MIVIMQFYALWSLLDNMQKFYELCEKCEILPKYRHWYSKENGKGVRTRKVPLNLRNRFGYLGIRTR